MAAREIQILDRLGFSDPYRMIEYAYATMSEQPTGNTGRWLKRITQSMSGEPRDLAELIEDLREASERGLFNGDALVMLEGVLAVADMQVRDIMVPRAQMVFVERDEAPDKLVELMVESGHSRFPVIGEDRDQILGILLAKDLLRLQIADGESFEIREFMRPACSCPRASGSTCCSRNSVTATITSPWWSMSTAASAAS